MTTSREQFRQWLEAPEGARLEFKEARHNYHFEKLLQVLPALSRNQVKRLLNELAAEGRAEVIGVTRAGRWFAIGRTGRIGSAGDDEPKKLQ